MFPRSRFRLSICLFALLTAFSMIVRSQTSEFTYQGKLADAGMSLTTYDFEFALYDVEVGGVALGTLPRPGVSTANGTFKVNLDFGAATFTGANRWLEVSVKRPADPNFTTLTPRVLITSSPYSIKSIASDTAADSLKLGGVDASEYVTTSSGAGTFVKNDTAQQTANFNVSGTGVIGNNLGIGVAAPQADLKLDVGGNAVFRTSNGDINFGTPGSETGMSITGNNRADLRFDGSTLKLVTIAGSGVPGSTNGIAIDTSGNLGVGTTSPATKFEVNGGAKFTPGGTGGAIQFGTPGGETGMTIIGTNRADIKFDGENLKLLATTGNGVPAPNNGLSIGTSGKVTIGTTRYPAADPLQPWELYVAGGSNPAIFGTSSGIGIWGDSDGNSAAVIARSGVTSSTSGALHALNTVGGNAVYADGNIYSTGNIRQAANANGMVKAMALIHIDQPIPLGPRTASIVRCYNSTNNSSIGNCGFAFGTVFSSLGVEVNFGFVVSTRFISLTSNSASSASLSGFINSTTATIIDGGGTNEFFIFVY